MEEKNSHFTLTNEEKKWSKRMHTWNLFRKFYLCLFVFDRLSSWNFDGVATAFAQFFYQSK